jgi:hypothetical protein
MNPLIEKYANAIKEADKAAIAAPPVEDRGTCNMDSVMVDFKGWRQKDINQVQALSGIRIGDKMTGIWGAYRFVHVNTKGQADLNTYMAQIAVKKLNELGVKATMWYQMD